MSVWSIGQAGLKTKTRKGLAALILAANMPDIDVFFGHSCWEPLATHRGFTHGLVGGIVVMPPILAGLLWLIDRWQAGRGAVFPSGLSMHFGWLVALCYVGAITHPLLDLQTSYAVQLLSPFSNAWFHEESLFIIDVWIWAGLSLAIWFSWRRQQTGGDWRWPARVALAAMLLYIGTNWLMTISARAALRDALPPDDTVTVFAGFEPVRFWERGLIYRGASGVGHAHWSPFSGLSDLVSPSPDNMDDPLARTGMFATPELVRFMRWSVMPVATVERGRCRAVVEYTDARFVNARLPWRDEATSVFRHRVELALPGPGCPAAGK